MAEQIKLEEKGHRIALLIDGDNISAKRLPAVIEETSAYGTISVRRIYGDWTSTQMGGWKDALQAHAVQPVQQFAYTTGKNATDSALIIDCMDLLHSGRFDAFCIVSSDSDYTRLAMRIREQGLLVIGIGEKKTPKALINACNVFILIENISPPIEPVPDESPVPESGREESLEGVLSEAEESLEGLLSKAMEMASSTDGWADLASVGNQLHGLDPSFDPRSWGHKRLVDLFKSITDYEVRYSNPEGPGSVFVRRKT